MVSTNQFNVILVVSNFVFFQRMNTHESMNRPLGGGELRSMEDASSPSTDS